MKAQPPTEPPKRKVNSRQPFSEWGPVFWWLIVLGFVAAIRIRLLAMPLERDEGEFAYVGQLMIDGIPPFKMAYMIKFPGTYALYALIMALFGQTVGAIHLGLLLVNAGSTVALFFLGRKLFDSRTGAIAAITFALMSLGEGTVGLAAHATQFVICCVLVGLLLLLRAMENARSWAFLSSGLLFGMAFILKQPGIIFGIFAGIILLTNQLQQRKPLRAVLYHTLLFTVGVMLPFAIMCGLIWRAGVFTKFWFWTVTCAGGRWLSLQDAWDILAFYFRANRVQALWWCGAGFGFILMTRSGIPRPRKIFMALFTLFSMVAVSLGFQFRDHYFVLLLPTIGLLIGIGITEATKGLSRPSLPGILRHTPVMIFAGLCLAVILVERKTFFELTPRQVIQNWYMGNPFCEAVDVAEYLKLHSSKTDRIAVIGSEPEIYFYSQRRSATGHLSTYILMEDHPFSEFLQQEMIDEISVSAPLYLVVVTNDGSWVQTERSRKRIFEWLAQFTQSYELVGVVDARSSPAINRWNEEARSEATPKSGLLVYRRK